MGADVAEAAAEATDAIATGAGATGVDEAGTAAEGGAGAGSVEGNGAAAGIAPAGMYATVCLPTFFAGTGAAGPIIVGNKINCSGATLFDDNRTDASSRRIVFTGNIVIAPATFDPSTLHNPATNIFAYSEDTTSKFYGNTATLGGLTVNGAVDINSSVSISGALTMETTDIKRNVDSSGLLIYGGTGASDGANLRFYGMTNGSLPGVLRMQFGGATGTSSVGYHVLEGRNSGGTVTEYFRANHTGLGWWGATPVAKPTVTGSRGGNAALDSLLTALANYGLITNSTS